MRKCVVVVMAVIVGVGVTLVSTARAGDRPGKTAKGVPVSFRLASSTAVKGFDGNSLADGRAVYVSPQVSFSRNDVVSAETRDDGAIELTLKAEAYGRLTTAMRQGSTDRLAIFVNRRLAAAPTLDSVSGEGRVTVTGLSEREMSRLSPLLKGRANVAIGPVVQVVPREASGQPGDLFTVDLFVNRATNLRVYQITLEAAGGRSGSLTRENVQIDNERADYVFGTAAIIPAVDQFNGRLGSLMFEGGVNVAEPKYLGSFSFRASDDAAGTFTIGFRLIDTFLTDPDGNEKTFRPEVGTITVGTG